MINRASVSPSLAAGPTRKRARARARPHWHPHSLTHTRARAHTHTQKKKKKTYQTQAGVLGWVHGKAGQPALRCPANGYGTNHAMARF